MIIREEYLVKLNAKNRVQRVKVQLDKHPYSETYAIRRITGQYGGKETDQPLININYGKSGRTISEQAGLQYAHILTEYLKDHVGYKIIDDTKSPEWNEQAWENIIKEMMDCLARMDENAYYDTKPCRYDETGDRDDLMKWYDEVEKEMDIAKRRFFFLFNKYFYDLWD